MTEQDPQGSPDPQATRPSFALGGWMAGLANAVERGLARELAPYNLTPMEFNLLRFCLIEKGEEITATQLAQMLPVDASRVSRIVTAVVDRGLLVRRRLPEDRRVVMLHLSPEGRDLTLRATGSMDAFVARLMTGVDEHDVEVFVSVFSQMIANHAAFMEQYEE
ncbi:MAG: MarR family transcriptional regulator [Chloroflexota bacterium]|nr:MarR family transcriptional regulator [Chloroflexota bacterium]MDE2884344.1 MarR family transcriptional regulator [Chloroflexota bacterium]